VKRREVLAGAAALAVAAGLRAQPRKVHRIGWPSAIPRDAAAPYLAAFEKGLAEKGYVIGRDAVVEFRHLGPRLEDVSNAIRELVRDKVDVLVTGTNPVTTAARSAAPDLPIVFVVGIDVVGQGFAKTFAAPGGNLTGLTWNVGDSSASKRLELLKNAAPKISRVAVLYDSGQDKGPREPLGQTAKVLEVSLHWIELSKDFDASFDRVLRERPDALFLSSGAQQFARRAEVIAFAAKNRLPAIFGTSEFVDAGGLMSYGPNVPDLYRRAASYVDRILKGAKAGTLPIEQPMRIDFEINQKTARQLGLVIPQSLLLRADRVIE
jgi:putative ABC transport system substrate-binding protein